MESCSLPAAAAVALATGLSSSLALQSLSLSSNPIGDEGVCAFASALDSQGGRRLRRLQLASVGASAESVRAIARAMLHDDGQCTRKLLSLNLACNPGIGDGGAQALADIIASSRGRLSQLDAFDCRISDRGVRALADALDARRGGPLTHVDIGSTTTEALLNRIAASLTRNRAARMRRHRMRLWAVCCLHHRRRHLQGSYVPPLHSGATVRDHPSVIVHVIQGAKRSDKPTALVHQACDVTHLENRFRLLPSCIGPLCPRASDGSRTRGDHRILPATLTSEQLALGLQEGFLKLSTDQHNDDDDDDIDGRAVDWMESVVASSRYRVLQELWRAGWYVGDGARLGADWLLYAGPPSEVHACASVVCVEAEPAGWIPGWKAAPTAAEAQVLARTATATNRALVYALCGDTGADEITFGVVERE